MRKLLSALLTLSLIFLISSASLADGQITIGSGGSITIGSGGSITLIAPFQPSDVPGLVAEFYSEFVIKDGADLVSQWTDQSGQLNHATQGTDTNKFLWVDNQINSYPALRADGSDNYMVADSVASIVAGQDTPFTLFMVSKLITASADRMFFFFWGAGAFEV